ncbi:MAG: DUF481 domain-containing protein [Kiritimatiellia bacterium]
MNKCFAITVLGMLSTLAVSGDVVLFRSGDKLSGTVKKVAGGKMIFKSEVAGKLTLSMDDIRTFSTDDEVTIEQMDGSQVKTKTTAAESGGVTLIASETTMPLGNIAKINPEKPAWHGAIVAGANLSRGNTHSDTASIDTNTRLRRENDRISFGAGYRFDKNRKQSTGKDHTSTDNWFLNGQYDYFMSKKLYLYGSLMYEKDRVANLDMRVSPGTGFGYQVIEEDTMNFSTEAGLNYVYEKYSDPSETREHIAIRLAYHLDKQLWENVKAFHNVTFLPSTERADIYLVYADVGVQTKLIDNWVMEAKAELDHDSKPAEGLDKTDYRYILGVGYTF